MPFAEWWFWIFVVIPLVGLGVGVVAIIAEMIVKVVKIQQSGSPEISQISKELAVLKEQLTKNQKMLELQKELSSNELQAIEQQSLPEGIAVFLFSDIEGFTQLMETLGDETTFDLLQRHNRIVRAVAQRFSGIELKQLGDGFMFCFSSAKKTLQCAAEIQFELGKLNEEGQSNLRVRIGVHAGEPIQDERDFIGQTVNMTERIMDQANGGQIFVSEVVKNIAGAIKGFEYVGQGKRRLGGINEAQAIYEFHRIQALASPLDSQVDRQLETIEKKLAPPASP